MKLPGDSTTPHTSDAQQNHAEGAHMPIGVGVTDLDGATEQGPKRSGSSPIVMIALVVVSGAVLWGMRHLGTRGSINLVDISIDYPIKDNAESANADEVIRALQDSAYIPQVEPRMVAVNPFTWRAAPDTQVTPEVDREAEQRRRAHEQRMRALDTAANNLRLNSVMRGRVPIANISGELVAVGDTVADKFTVTRIDGREVDIQAEGRTWTLTVGGD
ncbi:MAG: hypothetical protein Tsb0013_04320 [Phycisphaerales bacterium]